MSAIAKAVPEAEVPTTHKDRTSKRGRPRLTTILGVSLVLGWFAVAGLAPLVSPYNPLGQDAPPLTAPSMQHLFGTDGVGRDVLSRVLYGARVSLPAAFIVMVVALAIGVIVGAVSGYLSGVADLILMRIVELVLVFPPIILAMVVAAVLGPSLRNAIIALIVVSWPAFARVTRASVLSLREREFVQSSRLLGVSPARTLARDIMPNVVGPVIVLATLQLGQAILLLASLSFLGLGVVPPTAEWGSMVASGAFDFSHWWVATFAGIAILTSVLGFNLVGDSLRDRLDPSATTSVARVGRTSRQVGKS